MFDIFQWMSESFTNLFLDPKKRIFIGYLCTAWLLAIIWLILAQRQSLREATATVFSKAVWLSHSAKTDYLLLIINRLLFLFISPMLLGQLTVAVFWLEILPYGTQSEQGQAWPTWIITFLFTITLFLLDDGSRYWLHRWLHRSRILWQFHRTHHTAITLTPLTIFRTHPVEGILFGLRSAIVQGCCIGVFVFWFGTKVDLLSLFGVNIFLFLFNVFGANLRHSTIPIPYPTAIERWLLSPAQHQLHHSTNPQHFDRNFGVCLAIWDRMHHTFHHSERTTKLDFGIKIQGKKVQQSLWQIYISPFGKVFQLLKQYFIALFFK